MSVLGAQGAILGGHVAIGVFEGIQALLNPSVPQRVERGIAAMPDTHVHHVEGFGAEVLGHLQVFMEAYAVGGAVAPVHVPVAWVLLDGAYGTLPAEGVFRRDLALDEAAAGETHELRVHLVEHLRQVGAQAVFAVLERRREKADDV